MVTPPVSFEKSAVNQWERYFPLPVSKRRFLGVVKLLALVFRQNSLTSGIASGSSISLARLS